MKSKKAMRMVTIIVNALLFLTGGLVAYALEKLFAGFSTYGNMGVAVYASITMGIVLILVCIEYVAMLRIAESTYRTALIALFLLLYSALSPDMCAFYEVLSLPKYTSVCDIAGNICFIGIEVALVAFFRHAYSDKGKKPLFWPILAVGVACGAAYSALFMTEYKIYVYMAFVISVIIYFMVLQFRAYRSDRDDLIFAFASTILFSCAGMHTANVMYYAGVANYVMGFSSGYIWLCILAFVSIYSTFVIKTSRTARDANEYRLQNERLKMQVLVGQIKPHFIFNSLTAIKSMYHRDVSAGDAALELFSQYMRDSISLIDTERIPFEQELHNIARYIDFINTCQSKPFNVIYNIDVADFFVPAFSLQPFIENAVKYSRVNCMEDGYIMISAEAEGDEIVLKVSDNGDGYDMSRTDKRGHGISNACERFRLLFDTEPVIESAPSRGTTVTVRIAHNREE